MYNTTNYKVVHNFDYAASILSLALAVRKSYPSLNPITLCENVMFDVSRLNWYLKCNGAFRCVTPSVEKVGTEADARSH